MKLVVLTWNVLASPLHAGARVPALLRLLERSGADVIALQEVAPWLVARLRASAHLSSMYASTLPDGEDAPPSGLVILSRFPIERTRYAPLPTHMHRGALLADLRVDGQIVTFATIHLDSMIEDSALRARQLDAVFDLLAPSQRAVLLGDFNFGDDDATEVAHLPPEWTDAWLALHPEDPGLTWDKDRSEMARLGSFTGEGSRRLDRVMLRALSPESIELFGTEPVTPGDKTVFPSDHFGLIAALEASP